eukprot:gene42961-53305_t
MREKELTELQSNFNAETGSTADLQKLVNEMSELHERILLIVGVHSAKSRAASILSGLRFTEEMQNASIDSLSGKLQLENSLFELLISVSEELVAIVRQYSVMMNAMKLSGGGD